MSDDRYATAKMAWQEYFRWCQLQEGREQNSSITEGEEAEVFDLYTELESPGPKLCYAIAVDLLGCTDPLPAWLYWELCEKESNPKDATTYHAAAMELLTDHLIDGFSSSTWVRQLYPVFVKDAEVKGLPKTKEGFEAWLGAMTYPHDCRKAMRHWPPRNRSE